MTQPKDSRPATAGFATRAIHVGQSPEPVTGAVVPPIFMTSTFAQSAPGEHHGWEYSRSGNPTRSNLETCLADLEHGHQAFALASGSAATATVLQQLASGDHVVACDDLYGGTRRFFEQVMRSKGVSFAYVDLTEPQALATHLQPNTRLVWLESPTNPLLRLVDIRAIADLLVQSDPKPLLCVDNTFMSPYYQRPLTLGADIVVHSTTKYIGGHSDLIGGAIVVGDPDLAERMAFLANAVGAVQSPLDAWLTLRSLRTLAVRMEQHQRNAIAIATYLEGHPGIAQVRYPGLPSHPQHELAVRQMDGFGGMIAAELVGDLEQTRAFLSRVKLFTLAESLGGVESLVEHPGIMTHASIPADLRASIGISDTLVRLSVGLEDAPDLIADLEQALAGLT